MKEKILVTGAQGFIGTVLVPKLIKEGYNVIGTDIGYFKDCKVINYKDPIKIIKSDINELNSKYLKNVNVIVHLAALSNDPLGNLNKRLTEKINVRGTRSLAVKAKKMGVKKFLFSSSCIMYGSSSSKVVKENAQLKPLTEYAKSKVKGEKILRKMASKSFSPIFLRNGTIYGYSPRIRLDTVLNNFIGQAYTNKEIKVFGDGLPYRPVVHVDDVCDIIIKFIKADRQKIHNQAYNIGDEKLNFQIKKLADDVLKVLPKSKLKILKKDDADYRTYIASFNKLKKLFPNFKFKKTPKFASKEIYKILKENAVNKNFYNNKKFTRLAYLKKKLPNLFRF